MIPGLHVLIREPVDELGNGVYVVADVLSIEDGVEIEVDVGQHLGSESGMESLEPGILPFINRQPLPQRNTL